MSRPSIPQRLLIAWGLFIVYGTTLPFDLVPTVETVAEGWRAAHKVPWVGPNGGLPSIPDVVTNVLLFLPWGLLLGMDLADRRRGMAASILLGGVTALGASLTVELLQLFSSTRTSSATDLVTNTFGGAVGAALGWVAATRFRWSVGPWLRERIRRDVWSFLAGAVAIGTILWAVSPFDLTLDVDDVKRSIKSLRPIPFGPSLHGITPPFALSKAIASVLAWIPIGGVFALAGRRGQHSPRLLLGALFGLALATEFAQLLIVSHTTDATSVLFFCVGGAIGWGAVSTRADAEARVWAGPGLAVWIVATLVTGLSPWRFAPADLSRYGPERLLPFIHYFLRTDVYALGDAVVQILLYLPLGLLLRSRAVLVGGVVAALVEGSQLFTVGRVADTTDVALGALGGGVGTWLVARVRAVRAEASTHEQRENPPQGNAGRRVE